ncbi:Retrovirus-related Pol polyprotein from transposon RE2 [Vitis vinifera]|uniref:Retrovirus-related Pol polyprotein from transposon RE2 n=1 Tax=Vitis vinifera TaxID=29760 RepID=A0A438KNI0_VITVI|nr:Retrovirus-related Pol polyprotein from transposon RE2 [Vitis vinifera]
MGDTSWFLMQELHIISYLILTIYNHNPFTSGDKVIVGDGKGLSIANIDNGTIIEYHPSHFLVKDQKTRLVFLQGKNEKGFYKIPAATRVVGHPLAFYATSSISDAGSLRLLHNRLGHLFVDVVSKILSLCKIPLKHDNNNSIWLNTRDFSIWIWLLSDICSHHVVFDETQFPFLTKSLSSQPVSSSNSSSTLLDSGILSIPPPSSRNPNHPQPIFSSPITIPTDFVPSHPPSSPTLPQSSTPASTIDHLSLPNELLLLVAKMFALKDLGILNYFLGVEVYCKPIATLMTTSQTLYASDGSLLADPSQYHNIVGTLQYCTITRPDISFSINKLCQFMQSPTDLHWKVVKRSLRYLKGTTSFGLSFHSSLDLQLTVYADANWVGCPDDRLSTSGHCIFFGSNLVSWSSNKQNVVSRSSTKAEYRALANIASELQWIQHLLLEFSISSSSSPILLCDNLSATFLAANPIFHS